MEVNNYSLIFLLDFSLGTFKSPFSDFANEENDEEKLEFNFSDAYSVYSVTGVKNSYMVSLHNKMSREGAIIGLRLPYVEYKDLSTVEICQNTTLSSVVSNSIKTHVKGKWGDHIYAQCLGLLSKLEIRELRDLENLIECPGGIPSYVQKDLYEAARQINKPTVKARRLRCSLEDYDSLLKKFQSIDSVRKKTPKKTAMNQPVTFKNSVKSSGYTVGPKCTKLFTSPVNGKSNMKKGTDFSSITEVKSYPVNCGIPIYEKKTQWDRYHSSGILSLSYHQSGKLLATASADQSARYYKLNNSNSKSLNEHTGAVTSVSWSSSGHAYYGPLILTASVDHHARLWSIEKSESLLDFNNIQHSPRPGTQLQSKLKGFDSEVKAASFYYQDKFVTLASGKTIFLYSYELMKPDLSSIKPGFNPNRYKLLSTFAEPQAHSLTSFACVNNYKSHIFIQSTSEKSLHLWDVVTNQIFSTFTDAHSRWIHTIKLADYKFVPSTFENLFLTAAVTDGIKSWDIRSKKPNMHLTGHVNRASSIQCAFSPCGRYIGTGSEV